MAQDTGIKIRIRLKAYDHKVIDQSAKQIIDTAIRTGANVAGPVPLPTRRSTYTVVKSPHVYKMGGETYERRVHKRLIDITNATPKTIDSLQNLNLPAGVDAEIRMVWRRWRRHGRPSPWRAPIQDTVLGRRGASPRA